MNKNIYYERKPKDIESLPFIKNFGSVILTGRNFPFFRDNDSKWSWINILRKWDSDISEFDDFNDYPGQVFGYDLDLFDQRMGALFFEISSPIHLKAMYKNKTMATGKIFLHIYPCGYLIIFIAIDLKKENLTDFTKLSKAMKETKPDIKNKEWNWESRVKNGTLDIIINKIEGKIYDSIYEKKPYKKIKSDWNYGLKLITDFKESESANKILKDEYELIDLRNYITYDTEKQEYTKSPNREYLCISKNGFFIGLSTFRMPSSSSIHFFWKLMRIYEFVQLKNQVYKDYINFFKSEVNKLKRRRLNIKMKILEEKIFTFAIYDDKPSNFLRRLDDYVKNLAPFYRKIYSSMSSITGLDKQREKLLNIIIEWEKEVEQWTPVSVLLWRKIFSPLISILK